MGRGFNEAEAEVADNNGVAIVTDAYWRQRLNSDPNVLGRDIRVNTMPRKIVGVLPPDFRFLSSEARLFLPISPGWSSARRTTPFGRRRHAHDRALEAGRDDRRSASTDRRAQCGRRKRQSRSENDGRGWLSLAGAFAPCGSRALHPSDTLLDAGRRVFSPAHRRGQSGQPPADSRERARERNGDPPIDGREPAACGEPGDGGNHPPDCWSADCSGWSSEPGEFGCSKFSGPIACRSARTSRSMAGWRRSVSSAQ